VLTSRGVDGLAPIEAIPAGKFICWVSVVDRGEFGDQLEKNMENLEWLAGASVRHQQALAEIATEADVLPTRFGTVFLSIDSLLDHVKQNQKALATNLEKISGCEEWGIKVFADAPRVSAPAIDAQSGSDYLRQKAARLTRPGEKRIDAEITALVKDLREVAEDTAPAGKVSAGQPGLQWQGSFLISHRRRDDLQQLLQRYAAKWSGVKRIDCSGPWPPYSFVSTDGR
jgi:hypothetical protein